MNAEIDLLIIKKQMKMVQITKSKFNNIGGNKNE